MVSPSKLPYQRQVGISFKAGNYLGLNRHPVVLESITSATHQLGTFSGMPRMVGNDPLTIDLEKELARLVNQDIALVFPSTTHTAIDTLPHLATAKGVIFVDEKAYPISLDGVRAAAQRGALVHRFPHNDFLVLAKQLQNYINSPQKVIVCDGLYPARPHTALLRHLNQLAKTFNAVIYLDDAHGVGILGANPSRSNPYGHGGQGTPHFLNVPPGHIVHVGSLSKAFGVPIAFVAGPEKILASLPSKASTFVHCSPPSISDLAAAVAALQVHAKQGDYLRHRLLNSVRRFRDGLQNAGLGLSSKSLFPIQTIYFNCPETAATMEQRLRKAGVWTLLQLYPLEFPKGGALRFVITVNHKEQDIDAAVNLIVGTFTTITRKSCGANEAAIFS